MQEVVEGCWRPALKIRGGRAAPATAVGRSARACARASERAQDFRTIAWGTAGAGAGGGEGIPRFLAFQDFPDLGVLIPSLSLPSGKPLAQGRRGTKLTLPSGPRTPEVFWFVFWFFQCCVPNPREMNGSGQRGRCRPEFGAGDPFPRGPRSCASSYKVSLRLRAETLARSRAWRPPECAPSGLPDGPEPRSRPPSGIPPAGSKGLPPPTPPAWNSSRLVPLSPARAYFHCALLFA